MAFRFIRLDKIRPDFARQHRVRAAVGWADALRWAGTAFSAVAVFLGLYVQSGLALVPALIIALCVALVMSAAHAMYASAENTQQIADHVRELKAAIADLSEELHRVELAAMNFSGVEKLDQYVREFGRLNQDLRYISVTSEHLQDVGRLAAQLERLRTLKPLPGEGAPDEEALDAAMASHMRLAGGAETEETSAPEEPITQARSANVTEIEQFRGLVDRIRRHTEGRRCDGDAGQRSAFWGDVQAAVEANRVDFLVQPVLRLPDRKPVMYFAAIELRDREGCVLHFADCLGAEAEESEPEIVRELVPALDDRIVYKSLQMVQRLRTSHHVRGVFCPLDVRSLADDAFFTALLQAVGEASQHNGELVFVFARAQIDAQREVLQKRLLVLSEKGYRFALSGGEGLDLDFSWLRSLGFRYFALDARRFQEGLSDEDGAIDPVELLLSLKEAELVPMFTGVADREMFDRLGRHNGALTVGLGVAKPIRVDIEDFLDDDNTGEDVMETAPAADASSSGGAASRTVARKHQRPKLSLVKDSKSPADDDAA